MAWCLTKQAEENLRKALRKEGDPQKMVDRGSEGRLKWFEKYVGKENAERINYLFETKMLLKSQQRGFQSFVKYMGGPTEIKNDFLTKVDRIEKALSKTEVDQFFESYVSRRLGLTVTKGEYKVITDLSNRLGKLRENYDSETKTWRSEKIGAEFGATQVILNRHIENLKSGEKTVIEMLKDRGYQFKTEYKEGKARAVGHLLVDVAKGIAENSVSLVASVDDSFIGRQGIFTLLSGNPKVWGKTALSSMSDFVKVLGNKRADDALMASVFSDPLYMEGEYQKAKIVDRIEEQFPTTLPQRLPLVGRLLKASDVTFRNSGIRIRTGMYKILRDVNISRGIEMTPDQIQGLGKVVNSVSARGDLGRFENPIIRLFMWAPKMLKADLDILTAHQFSNIPKASKRIALDNLAKIILTTAIINGLFTLDDPDKTEFNPLSSDFLALKFGDTRFKFLRGISGIITLLARMITGKYKSATTGEIKEYGSGFAQMSRFDTLVNFFVNKAPPATRSVVDITRGRNFKGDPPTLSSVLMQAGVPISIQNVIELTNNPTIDATFGVIADFFGFSSSTFRDSNKKTDIIPKETVIKNEDFVSMIQVYAKAMGTDSETAWNRIFTGQKIYKVQGGLVIVERDTALPVELKREYQRKYGGEWVELRADHTIPIELGGSDSADNIIVMSKSLWSSYTKTEVAVIKATKGGKISKKDARAEIIEFKGIDDTADRKKYGDDLRKRLEETQKDANKKLLNFSLVRKAYASEKDNGKKIGEQERRWYKTAIRLRESNPEWYEKNVGRKGEVEMFGFELGPAKAKPKTGRNPVFKDIKSEHYEPSKSAIKKASEEYKVPLDLMVDIAFSESSFDPNEKNPNSSASGLFQFTDATWIDAKKQFGNEISRFNADDSAMVAAWFISRGYLGKWNASKNKWGKYYKDKELEIFY